MNIEKSIKLVLVFSLVWLTTINVFAQDIPKQSNPPTLVVDKAEIFSPQERAYLESELVAFSDSTSNQIVVVTMNDLQDYAPYEVATKIGHTWGVGQDGFDNGVVILIKPKTTNSKGQIFITAGYGLEGAIPDATAKMVVEREIIPYFKQGRMFDGVQSGLITIKALAVGEYNSDAYAAQSSGAGGTWFPFVFIILVFGISMIGRARSARSYSVGHNVPFWTALMLMNQSSGHGGHYNNFTSGGGGFGGGGFGGFGGGGFGGGGAGGSW